MSKDSPPPPHHKNVNHAHGIVKANDHNASRAGPSRVKTYYPPRDPYALPESPKSPERPDISPISSPTDPKYLPGGMNRQETASARKTAANDAPGLDDNDVIEVEVRKPGTYDNEADSDSEPSPKPRKVKKTSGRRKTAPARTTKRKNADRRGSGGESSDSDAPIARKRRRTTLPASNPPPSPEDVDEDGSELDFFGETDSEFEREDRDSYQVNIRISVLTDPAATHAIIEEKVEITDADTIDKCQAIIARLRDDDMDLYFNKAETVAYRVVGFDNLDEIHLTVYDASWVNVTRTTERQFAEWADTVKFVDNMMGTLTAQFLVIDAQSAVAEATGGGEVDEEANVDGMDELENEGQESSPPESPVRGPSPADQRMEESPIPESPKTHSPMQSPFHSSEQSSPPADIPYKIEEEDGDDEQSALSSPNGLISNDREDEGHDQSLPVPPKPSASTNNDEVTDEDHLAAAALIDLAQLVDRDGPDSEQPPAIVPDALANTEVDQRQDRGTNRSSQSHTPPNLPSPVLPNGQIKAKVGPGQRVGRRKPSGKPGDWMGRSTSAETTVPVTQMNMGEYDLWKAKEADYDACYTRNVSIERENSQLRKKVAVLEHQLAVAKQGDSDTPVLADEDIDEAFDKLTLKREVEQLRHEKAELKRWRQGRLTIDLEKGSTLLKALANMSDALNAVFNDIEIGDSDDEDEENDGRAGASKGKEVARGSRLDATATGAATTSAGSHNRTVTYVTSEGFRTENLDPVGGYEESNLRTTGGREEDELPAFRF